jgi:hypothetical protein
MKRAAMERLVGKQVCGGAIGRKLCLLRPGHEGDCSPWWPKEPLTREERLERELAKLRADLAASKNRAAGLKRRLLSLERHVARMESYTLFKIEYRARGSYRRARRYWRIVWHRTGGRLLGTWPPRGGA